MKTPLGIPQVEDNEDKGVEETPKTEDKKDEGQSQEKQDKKNVEEPNKQPEEQAQEQGKQEVLTDDSVLNFLKEKGVEINSFDDLKKEEAKEDVFASEEVQKINEFIKDTNKSVSDYIKATEDVDSLSNEDAVKRYLTDKGEAVDYEDAEMTLEDEYSPLEIPEDAEDAEVARIKRQNKKREKKLEKLSLDAKNHLKGLQEKYKAPSESFDEKMNKVKTETNAEFGEKMQKAINQLDSFSFNEGGFEYKIDNPSKYQDKVKSIDGLMDSFKNGNGEFDYGAFASTLVKGFEADNMVDSAIKQARNDTTSQHVQEKRNVDGVGAVSREGGEDPYKASENKMKEFFRVKK